MNRHAEPGWQLSAAAVRNAVSLVEDARTPTGVPIVAQIEDWVDATRPRGARAADRPYPVRALLALHIALTNAGVQLTYSNMLNIVWFSMRRKSLRQLGLDSTVTPGRRLDLGDPETNPRGWAAETERFRAAMARMVEAFDPSPHRQMLRQTNAELAAVENALTTAERECLAEKRRRLLLVCNALIDASVRRCTESLRRDVGWDWRDDWWGDLLIDGHMVAIARAGRGSGTAATAPDGFHGYDPDSGYWHRDRDAGEVWAHQVTIAMSAHRTYKRQVPLLGLAMSIGKPNSGDVRLTRETLRAARDAGYSPPRARRPRLIADMGFTEKLGYAGEVHALGYDRVLAYPENVITDHDLGNGLLLLGGVPVCAQFADRIRRLLRKLPNSHWDLCDEEFLAQEKLERLVTGARAHLHKRWRPSTNGTRMTADGAIAPGGAPGRPGRDPKPLLWLSQAGGCGADWMEAKCPRKPLSLDGAPPDAPTADVPFLSYSGGRADLSGLPEMCTKQYSALRLTDKQFKQAQEFMAGTWEHNDIYLGARSSNERYHSQLKSRAGGALGKDTRHITGTARVALVCAAAIAVTNLRQTAAFRRRIKRHDRIPYCTRLVERDSRRRRAKRLAQRHRYK